MRGGRALALSRDLARSEPERGSQDAHHFPSPFSLGPRFLEAQKFLRQNSCAARVRTAKRLQSLTQSRRKREPSTSKNKTLRSKVRKKSRLGSRRASIEATPKPSLQLRIPNAAPKRSFETASKKPQPKSQNGNVASRSRAASRKPSLKPFLHEAAGTAPATEEPKQHNRCARPAP